MNVICKELILKQGKPQTYQEGSLSSSDTVRKHLDHMDTYTGSFKYASPSLFLLVALSYIRTLRFIAVSNASTTKRFSWLLIACLTSVLQE